MKTKNESYPVEKTENWREDPDAGTAVSPYLLRPARTYEEYLRDRKTRGTATTNPDRPGS